MRIIIAGCLLIIAGCSPRKITTTWKTDPVFPGRYHKILVVAVLPESDSILRKTIESETVRSLSAYGYDAVSATVAFGPRGLAASGEAGTYLRLCSNGIDAVMTIALVPKGEDRHYAGDGQYFRTNSYYYDRIWNYKKMQAAIKSDDPENEYFWESILFDLLNLQATTIIRTRTFTDYKHEKITNGIADLVIKKMTKEKIIKRKNTTQKAF